LPRKSQYVSDMPRYAVKIAYDGTNYHGWQRQETVDTVQERLETALKTILREDIGLVVAGRTDTGVHARGQVAHFDSQHNDLEFGRVLLGTRALLPRDIVVSNIRKVTDDFHARFDAKSREYSYAILQHADPFMRHISWVVHPWVDISILDECASILEGEMDFTSFCKADSAEEHNRCTILLSKWDWSEVGKGVYRVRANRFVHHMVRGLVGTMVRASRNGNSEYFRSVLESGTRSEAVFTAPGKGLILEEVVY
jgi:tRNA pseudouridine38-40 synthase